MSPAEASTSTIELDAVSKEFLLGSFWQALRAVMGLPPTCPTVQALTDVTLDVQEGELLGVLGRNGAGKSTLLRVAGGVYAPDRGNVRVRGDPTAIFEMGMLGNAHLTGRQFCHVYFTFRDVPRRQQAALVEEVKEFSELEDYFEEPLRTYSTGMLARVLFGAVTALRADLVLLDEILSVGDERFKGKSFRRLQRLVSGGVSGIFATHDWLNAMRLCRRMVVLERGRVEFCGPAEEAVRRYLKPIARVSGKVRFLHRERLISRVTTYEPGAPFTFEFELESTVDEVLAVAMAIELPRRGVVAVVDNDTTFGGEAGVYRVRMTLPEMPIAAPECALTLAVVRPRRPGELSTEEVHDQISWTTAESLPLEAAPGAPPSSGFIHRRLAWRRVR